MIIKINKHNNFVMNSKIVKLKEQVLFTNIRYEYYL